MVMFSFNIDDFMDFSKVRRVELCETCSSLSIEHIFCFFFLQIFGF